MCVRTSVCVCVCTTDVSFFLNWNAGVVIFSHSCSMRKILVVDKFWVGWQNVPYICTVLSQITKLGDYHLWQGPKPWRRSPSCQKFMSQCSLTSPCDSIEHDGRQAFKFASINLHVWKFLPKKVHSKSVCNYETNISYHSLNMHEDNCKRTWTLI